MAECNYSIVLDESKGRVLVAKNDIPQGDLILQEAPLGEFFLRRNYFALSSSWDDKFF